MSLALHPEFRHIREWTGPLPMHPTAEYVRTQLGAALQVAAAALREEAECFREGRRERAEYERVRSALRALEAGETEGRVYELSPPGGPNEVEAVADELERLLAPAERALRYLAEAYEVGVAERRPWELVVEVQGLLRMGVLVVFENPEYGAALRRQLGWIS